MPTSSYKVDSQVLLGLCSQSRRGSFKVRGSQLHQHLLRSDCMSHCIHSIHALLRRPLPLEYHGTPLEEDSNDGEGRSGGGRSSIYSEVEVTLVRRFGREFEVESLGEWKMTSRPPARLVDSG